MIYLLTSFDDFLVLFCCLIIFVKLRPFTFHIHFKGPEFVRKHILNKHGDKIEEVKKEVVFFNNFLMDAKRPSLPEMKLPPLPGPGQGRHNSHDKLF